MILFSCVLFFRFSLLFSAHYFFFFAIVVLLLSLIFSPYYNSYSLLRTFLYDDLSLFMSFMLLCVIFMSSFLVVRFPHISSIILLFISIVAVCYVLFRRCRILFVYIRYEISLIPIILIIIVWGSYPERSLSSLILLIYTCVFTIPFIFVLFYVFLTFSRFYFTSFDSFLPPFFSLVVFLAFAVKLPVYGLHFWLPIAHVEAPTFGSIILAGILLKLGGVGLIRCYSLID